MSEQAAELVAAKKVKGPKAPGNGSDLDKILHKIDKFMAKNKQGIHLWRLLSGSVRGPDDGPGKVNTCMPLRSLAFPLTHHAGSTGASFASDGAKPHVAGTEGTSHYRLHVNEAIASLKLAGRLKEEGK